MKKIVKLFFLSSLMAVAFCSCETLSTDVNNEFNEYWTWTNGTKAEGILAGVYRSLIENPDAYDGNFLDVATDNAYSRLISSSAYRMGHGDYTSVNNPIEIWKAMYDNIQTINMFLEKGLGDETVYSVASADKDAQTKIRLKGEAYFLRAWCEFKLLQMYGGKAADGKAYGCPILTSYEGPEKTSQVTDYTRASYEDYALQVVNDCEAAFELLPLVYTGGDAVIGSKSVGRANGLAAAALKVKVLVYAASPAYQPDNIVKLNGMGSFTVVDEAAYKAKWERAALYADEVLKLSGMESFKALSLSELSDATSVSDEFVFRFYLGSGHALEDRHYPPSYYGAAQTVPSENLVEAFPSKTGYPVTDPRSNYDPTNPYAIARDKRFEMNVFYHGRIFGKHTTAIDVTEGGKDSYYFSSKASATGYYLGKFINVSKDKYLTPLEQQSTRHYNPMLRKAEVWLNYAEAANEAWGPKVAAEGCKYTAFDVIKTVRNVSGGITDVTYLNEMAEHQASFRSLIQNERRLEFAFENQRFWDLRRCLLPLSVTIQGMSVKKGDEGTAYQVIDVESRTMEEVRYYYLPLPYAHVKMNPNLINNLGW